MAELADALDLGSSGFTVQVQILLPAYKASWPDEKTFNLLLDISGMLC